MKRNNIKKILKIISEISIVGFGLLYVLEKFFDFTINENGDFKNILVVLYLITTLIFYKMELKDKNLEISQLKFKLNKKNNENSSSR